MKSSWLKRYITLTNTKLEYYTTKDAPSPLKAIEITKDCYVREISQKSGVKDCRDAIQVFYERGKSIILKGTSQRESTEWMTGICNVVDSMIGSEEEFDDEFDFVDEDEFIDEDDFVEEKAIPVKEPKPFSSDFVEEKTTISAVSTNKSESFSSTPTTSIGTGDDIEWWDEDEDMIELEPVDNKKDEQNKPEADKKAKEEADKKAKEEAERKIKEEADRRAKEEADKKAKEEADKKAKAEADKKAKEEAEKKSPATKAVSSKPVNSNPVNRGRGGHLEVVVH